uniref:Uncharacterized protein n=1 Tax=Anopheles culicifacies TaxID=139723 RepID=A0A182MMH9_9DIPT
MASSLPPASSPTHLVFCVKGARNESEQQRHYANRYQMHPIPSTICALDVDILQSTSTRKPRLNSALAAQQAATQAFPGASGGSQVGTNVKSPGGTKALRSKGKRSKHPARLKNIDRSSGQTREVTVNSVTVVITEYKPKPSVSRHDSSESFSESNDSRS